MAKNYLRESRLSHKQAKKTLTSAIILSEFYCFARVLLLLAAFFIGWLVLSKLPFAKEWNLPATIFGVFATLTRFDLPTTQIVVQWAGVLVFVGVVLAVVFNIFSAQITLLKAFKDVDRRLYGDRYLQAYDKYENSVKNLCHYVSRYRHLLKFFEEELYLTQKWHKNIHKSRAWNKVFKSPELNGQIVERELKSSKRTLKKIERSIKKEEKKLLKDKRSAVKAAKKKWKSYWKAQKKEAIAQAKQNVGTKKGNLKLLKAKKKTLYKEFNAERANRFNENLVVTQEDRDYTESINNKMSELEAQKLKLKGVVANLRAIVESIEKTVSDDLGLNSRKTACGIALNNRWVLKQIKKYEKAFKKETKRCKKSLSREQRNKILYRRCRNVRELLFPEKDKMRPNYAFQWLTDAIWFLKRFKKTKMAVLLGEEDYSYYKEEWERKFGIIEGNSQNITFDKHSGKGIISNILQSESVDNDPYAYEVNGYDEGVRKAGRDFTQWKRGSKKDTIYLYERPIFSEYTYNKGYCINVRNVVYGTFLAFVIVALVGIFKAEISVADYFKSLKLLFIPVGVGALFHFVLGCWAGTIVKIRADEDVGEWFDITIANQFKEDVGELLPLRNHERRAGSLVKNTRRNRAFILHKQPREFSVTLYFFRNLCQFLSMAGLMWLEVSLIHAVSQDIAEATKLAGDLSQILAWVMIGACGAAALMLKRISRYVFSMNEYNVDCMEDDVRAKARKRYKAPMLFMAAMGIVSLVALIVMGMMEISYLAMAGLLFFVAIVAWLADCVIHHKDVDMDDYGFFMESDSEEERDPSDFY